MTRFAEDFQAHHGEPATVTEVTRDMSRAFIKGDTSHFPEAAITFDKCQGIKFLGDAVDQVRREGATPALNSWVRAICGSSIRKTAKLQPPVDSRTCAKPMSKSGGAAGSG